MAVPSHRLISIGLGDALPSPPRPPFKAAGRANYPFPKPKECGVVNRASRNIQVPHSTHIEHTPVALGANASMTFLYAES